MWPSLLLLLEKSNDGGEQLRFASFTNKLDSPSYECLLSVKI